MTDDNEFERVDGMADAHECVMTAYRKALDALDFMFEVQREITTYPKPTSTELEKISYARSVLAVMMETFDDEYYKVIERVKEPTEGGNDV
jgi:hypothetical protein